MDSATDNRDEVARSGLLLVNRDELKHNTDTARQRRARIAINCIIR